MVFSNNGIDAKDVYDVHVVYNVRRGDLHNRHIIEATYNMLEEYGKIPDNDHIIQAYNKHRQVTLHTWNCRANSASVTDTSWMISVINGPVDIVFTVLITYK